MSDYHPIDVQLKSLRRAAWNLSLASAPIHDEHYLAAATVMEALRGAQAAIEAHHAGLRVRLAQVIGDSPSVREPPPVEASPSPRERSSVGAKRPLDLCSAVSVLASGGCLGGCSPNRTPYHQDYDGAPVEVYCSACGARRD